ncbi:hypothetical protein ON010_g18713 [Phytophthora cinnamomi]|nr:hypothetical protein ON010_g18713 [Phytophthora cinnamomi]
MEQADLHPSQTSLLDAPPLLLRVTLGGNGLSIHGQDAFVSFARPVVSADKISIRYDGLTTISQGDTLRTYMIVDGAGYVVTTSEDPTISRTVECLSSVSPFDLILAALNNTSVTPSTVLCGESIQCPSGPLLQASFGGVDFALCTAGRSGVNVLGTSGSSAQVIDMIVTIEYQSSPLTSLSAPHLSDGDALCAPQMMPTSVTPTTLALLTVDAILPVD